jgi:uncharacterized membrane protein
MDLLLQITQTQVHNTNIFLHVLFGSIAIVLGIIQLFTPKGGKQHSLYGKLFLGAYAIVIGAAILGALFFEFRVFLVVLTFTAAYSCTSGYRVLSLRGKRPAAFDNIFSFLGIVFCLGFTYSIDTFPLIMSKTTVLATLGALFSYCIYDILRNFLALNFLTRSWLYEHMIKMISALSALLSGASGNLLPNLGTFSQLMPTLFTTILIGIFIVRMKNRPHGVNL